MKNELLWIPLWGNKSMYPPTLSTPCRWDRRGDSIFPNKFLQKSLYFFCYNCKTMPSKLQVLSLLRSILRHSSKISNYNFREHARRRTLQGFRSNRTLNGVEQAAAYEKGLAELQVVIRQSVISQLYPDMGSVVSTSKGMHSAL